MTKKIFEYPVPCPLKGEALIEWQKWLESRPEDVQKLVISRPPWCMYTWTGREEGAVYQIICYDEVYDGAPTLRVQTYGELGLVPRVVFGVDPADLVIIQEH